MIIKSSRILYLFALSTLLLGGCANMSKEQCETANWQAIGYEDGVAGQRDSQFSQHRQECADHGVTASIDDYLSGHKDGSQKYCTKTNGFFLGMKGKSYNRNCPDALAKSFLVGLADGKQIYSAERRMLSSEDALDNIYARIENFEEVINDKNDLMIADGLVRAERIEIRQQIQKLEVGMFELIESIPAYQNDYDQSLKNYQQVKQSFVNYF
ncbi:MAG: hypothetical protein ACI97K_001856 [Glaciecola sp.]|jgi:hypothetical protein